MTYVPRALALAMRRALKSFPAVLVTGARQSGKTTLLQEELGRTHAYISLERPDVRARALADPIAFLQENPPPLILDEIQHVPELLPYIKDAIDTDRRPGRWLLTGSQSFPLMRGISQTLAGRVAVLTLDPLSVDEVGRRSAPRTFDSLLERVFGRGGRAGPRESGLPEIADWLLRGGYPELRLNPHVDRDLWLSSYVQTYLQRDVRDLAQVGDLNAFARFLALAATRTGNLLNMAELGREIGVSGPTAKHWLSVLEASHVVHLLQPFHRNLGKRVRKSPKLYMNDVGLASQLLGLHSAEAVLHGPSYGALVETAVIAEWRKALHNLGAQATLSFWRTSVGDEVDLIIEYDGRLHGLEVKATATPTPHHAEGLRRWLKLAGPSARAALACRVPAPVTLAPGVRAVPWHLAW